jgi:hypothetical protein
MAIDGLGSKSPLTPPLDLDTPPANQDLGASDEGKDTPKAGGTGATGGTGAAGNVAGATPLGDVSAPVAPIVNVISPAVSAPKPNSTPLDRPKLVLPSQATSLSVGDLIMLIQAEIQKTSDALAEAQNSQIKQDGLKQQAANTSQIEALNDAANQILEAQEMQEAMEIANWCLFAITCLAIGFTMGFMSPLLAVTVITQVPIEGKNLSGWVTEGLSLGIEEYGKAVAIQALKDNGYDPKKAGYNSYEEAFECIEGLADKNEEVAGYSAMAALIALEVMVAVIVSVVTFGSGAPAAAGTTAGSVTSQATGQAIKVAEQVAEQTIQKSLEITEKVVKNTVEQTVKAAQKSVELTAKVAEKTAQETTQVAQKVAQETAQVAEKAAQETANVASKATQNAAKIAVEGAKTTASEAGKQSSNIQKALNVTQAIGSCAKDLAIDGVQIDIAIVQEKGSEATANAEKIKGYIKFLQQILKADQEFLKELIDMQANIAETTRGILQTEHTTNMHIASLTTHA